jgi:transposase-like protein
MEDYPRNLREFEARFATEQACRDYLFQMRWPEGFRCPKCVSDRYWPVRSVWMQCRQCGHQTSVTAGTIFQDTRKPLADWFRAMYWLTSQKNGASAIGLQAVLGLGSYKTAWTWLHKLRRAMVRPGRDRMSGRVQVDETYLGGVEEGVHGRQTERKSLIVIAVEEDGRRIGRIRMKRIPDASGSSLTAFLDAAVEPGSTVQTDGWQGYSAVGEKGYVHEVTVVKGKLETASELLPHVHLVVSLLKRWILGTHQGAVSHEHLEFYLDEFTFRFSRRRSANRGKLFYRLVQQAVLVEPVPYKSMVRCSASPRKL